MSGRGYPDAGDIGREYATPSSYGHQENPEHNDPFDYSPLAFGGGPAIASSMQNDNYQMRSAAIHNPSMQHQQYNREMKPTAYQQQQYMGPPAAHSQPPSQFASPQRQQYNPFGYNRSSQASSYNGNGQRQQQSQRSPNNFGGQSRYHPPAASFGDEQQQHLGGFTPAPYQNHSALASSGGSDSFPPRPVHNQQPFLPPGPQRFNPVAASQSSFQQQQFGHIPQGNQQQEFSNNLDMPSAMLYNKGMNGHIGGAGRDNQPQQQQMMMNETDDFSSGDFGAPGEMGVPMSAQYVLSEELMARISSSQKKQVLLELQIGLEQIAFDTNVNFSTWATVIKERMCGRDPLQEADLRIAADILVEMAVVLDDSQYNFSRLGQFLGSSISDFSQNVLLPQVSAFVTETNTFLSAQHLRNLISLLAELYDKIEVKGVKSSLLAAHSFDQLHNILKLPMDEPTIGVIVKVLKLVGRFLENDRGPQAMDEFFSELEEASKGGSDSAKEKVRNLVALRKKQWGVTAEGNAGNGTFNFPSLGILGPDGEQLTEDECTFLDENFDMLGNSPSGSLYNPMEDDNVEDDYEQFLQATAIQAAEKALENVSIDKDDDALLSPKFPGAQQ